MIRRGATPVDHLNRPGSTDVSSVDKMLLRSLMKAGIYELEACNREAHQCSFIYYRSPCHYRLLTGDKGDVNHLRIVAEGGNVCPI